MEIESGEEYSNSSVFLWSAVLPSSFTWPLIYSFDFSSSLSINSIPMYISGQDLSSEDLMTPPKSLT